MCIFLCWVFLLLRCPLIVAMLFSQILHYLLFFWHSVLIIIFSCVIYKYYNVFMFIFLGKWLYNPMLLVPSFSRKVCCWRFILILCTLLPDLTCVQYLFLFVSRTLIIICVSLSCDLLLFVAFPIPWSKYLFVCWISYC